VENERRHADRSEHVPHVALDVRLVQREPDLGAGADAEPVCEPETVGFAAQERRAAFRQHLVCQVLRPPSPHSLAHLLEIVLRGTDDASHRLEEHEACDHVRIRRGVERRHLPALVAADHECTVGAGRLEHRPHVSSAAPPAPP
jgi:hypothetical protein